MKTLMMTMTTNPRVWQKGTEQGSPNRAGGLIHPYPTNLRKLRAKPFRCSISRRCCDRRRIDLIRIHVPVRLLEANCSILTLSVWIGIRPSSSHAHPGLNYLVAYETGVLRAQKASDARTVAGEMDRLPSTIVEQDVPCCFVAPTCAMIDIVGG